MEFGEMKRNTSNWSNFCLLPRRVGLSASAGLSCLACRDHNIMDLPQWIYSKGTPWNFDWNGYGRWRVTYLTLLNIVSQFKSAFKHNLFSLVYTTERLFGIGKWRRRRAYIHKNCDLEPVHRSCTKLRIELLHNAPICLELWRSLALSKLGYTLTCSGCRWRTLNRKE